MSLNVDSRELIEELRPRMSFIFSISEENGHDLASMLSMVCDALGHDGAQTWTLKCCDPPARAHGPVLHYSSD